MQVQVPVKSSNGTMPMDIETTLLGERKIFLQGVINEETGMNFIKQVMWLNTQSTKKPIFVYINSKGGEIQNSGLLIYDVIVSSQAPIITCCVGAAYSMAAVLFAAGKKRYMLPNSELMLHQPLLGGNVSGNASSIQSISDSLLHMKERINKILSKHTGRSVEEIDRQTGYDHYFSPEQAISFGLCDGIKSFDEMLMMEADDL